jgi:hypothetical protein
VGLFSGRRADPALLADLQAEARDRLPLAGLSRRVVVRATAPEAGR